MLVTCEEMRRIESAAFSRGVSAEHLMEEAGLGIARIVRQFHSRPGTCIAYCGKGNNGGDALVALRHLRRWGWSVSVELAYPAEELSDLPRKHLLSLDLSSREDFGGPLVLLDGLLGTGVTGEPRKEVADAIRRMNSLRLSRNAWILAIDIPSGLNGDTGISSGACVQADLTATIGMPKQGLVADEATNHVGRLALIPLHDLEIDRAGFPRLSTPDELRYWLPPRAFDTHKGMCGRVGIVAGSHGMTGAARLASAAAVAAGAGLVTVYAHADIQPVLAASCVPEVMVKQVDSFREVLNEPMNVLAVGPGLGRSNDSDILALVREWPHAMVIDADALNAVSQDTSILKTCRGPRLITPHPGEMERLFPQGNRSRIDWFRDFTSLYPVTLLLKGARTIIGTAETCYYNSTGNPGMASGGMGDVLTGTCAALAGQLGGDLLKSAVLGAWICGRAGEMGASTPFSSPEKLSARIVVELLGAAFSQLREGY